MKDANLKRSRPMVKRTRSTREEIRSREIKRDARIKFWRGTPEVASVTFFTSIFGSLGMSVYDGGVIYLAVACTAGAVCGLIFIRLDD